VVVVTPESTYPLSPTDPKPLPTMPREFLPNTRATSALPAAPQPAAAAPHR